MNLRQLTYFVRIAELQSVSKAASVLRIAQPALSRQIHALEQELGAPLLTRHGWGVTPTAAGSVLLDHAKRVLRETQLARDSVQAMLAEPNGEYGIGIPSSLALALMPPLADYVQKNYPRVRLKLTEGFSASLHQWVIDGHLDMAVLYDARSLGPLNITPLFSEEIVLAGPPGQFGDRAAVDVDALPAMSLIMPSRPNRLRLMFDELQASIDAEFRPVQSVDSVPAIIDMIQRGQGVTLLPYAAVHPAISRGALSFAYLKPRSLNRTMVLVRPLDRQPTAATDMLSDAIRKLVLEQAGTLRWNPLCV